jgi:pimeloyl-ACP methyl ester carboxylesterase
MKIIKIHTDRYLKKNNFIKMVCNNGLIIWYKIGLTKPNHANIFIHSSIGGLSIYKNFINKLSDKIGDTYTTILLEIPGISFGNNIYIPPTIYSITQYLVSFIKLNKINNINIMGHSFGCNVVSCLINRFYKDLRDNGILLNKTILIEGLVFLPRLMNIYKFFNENSFTMVTDIIKRGNYRDLVSIPFFYRDLYLQFYMQRCLSLTDSTLVGLTEYEQLDNKIHLILSEDDDKIIVNDLVYYLQSKRYKCDIKIFDNVRHGDFAFDERMQDHAIELLNKV